MLALAIIALVFSAVAAIAAAIAVTLSTVQLLTRHRPFVGISQLEMLDNPSGSEIVVTLHNWGEVIGEHVRVTIGSYIYMNSNIPQHPRERYLDELFPGQTMILTEEFPSGVIKNWALNEGDLLVKVAITYENPVFRLLRRAKTRQYNHDQIFWVTHNSWGAMAP